jgi:hypothetical protein
MVLSGIRKKRDGSGTKFALQGKLKVKVLEK